MSIFVYEWVELKEEGGREGGRVGGRERGWEGKREREKEREGGGGEKSRRERYIKQT